MLYGAPTKNIILMGDLVAWQSKAIFILMIVLCTYSYH